MWASLWWWWAVCIGCVGGGRLPTSHPIMASLRDTPVSPRPSLRSQWRGAATDPRGRTILEIAYDFCSNSLNNLPTKQMEAESQQAVKQVLGEDPPPGDTISIMVQMVHDTATAYVHGLPVPLHNCTALMAAAGVVTVMVVHPATARVIRMYHHPANAHARPLRAFLDTLQPGRLLILVASVVWAEVSVEEVVRQLGASMPPQPTWSRTVWVWVGVVGGGTLGQVGGSWRVSLELYLPRAPDVPWCGSALPSTLDEPRWASRVELCTTYDGYGNWCFCPPSPILPPPPPLAAPPLPPPPLAAPPLPLHALYNTTTSMPQAMAAGLEDAVTVVLASRPESLHRLLVSVAVAGAPLSSVLVFVSELSHEVLKVCESHGVQVEETGRASDCTGLHIARLYESALTASLILRPKADYFIILEDDMIVAPTFYRWMGRGREVLKSSEEFVCVNSLTQYDLYTHYTYHNPHSPEVNQPHGLVHQAVEARKVSTKTPGYVSRRWTSRGTEGDISDGADATTSSSGGYHNNLHTSHTSLNNSKRNSPFLPRQIKLREASAGRTGPPVPSKLEASMAAVRKDEPSVASNMDDKNVKAAREGSQRSGVRLMAGWAAARTVVEALIRSWPLAKRDVDWETLVDVWAGPAPCLTPARPHAVHARASHHHTLGDDLPPILL
nr:uncharacterized protein LOC123769838 isoform X1 [Procambarus clarkii]XP_045617136.1 uncharacterized protein LOC123769838 isoform X2 [Procambarus clarkii]